jgi:hypothetical protein
LHPPRFVGIVLHYQFLQQQWKQGGRGTVLRVCVVTDSRLFLLDEDYVGDGFESIEGGSGQVESSEKALQEYNAVNETINAAGNTWYLFRSADDNDLRFLARSSTQGTLATIDSQKTAKQANGVHAVSPFCGLHCPIHSLLTMSLVIAQQKIGNRESFERFIGTVRHVEDDAVGGIQRSQYEYMTRVSLG